MRTKLATVAAPDQVGSIDSTSNAASARSWGRKPQLLSSHQQSLAFGRTAELERQRAGAEETQRPLQAGRPRAPPPVRARPGRRRARREAGLARLRVKVRATSSSGPGLATAARCQTARSGSSSKASASAACASRRSSGVAACATADRDQWMPEPGTCHPRACRARPPAAGSQDAAPAASGSSPSSSAAS